MSRPPTTRGAGPGCAGSDCPRTRPARRDEQAAEGEGPPRGAGRLFAPPRADGRAALVARRAATSEGGAQDRERRLQARAARAEDEAPAREMGERAVLLRDHERVA